MDWRERFASGGFDRPGPMLSLIVGVCQVSLLIRHAHTLKDKRHVLKGIVQKLRNEGFSVSEIAYAEEPKRGSLGFAYVGATADAVQHAIDRGMRFFVGDFEVLDTHQDIFDYSDRETADFDEAEGHDPRSGEGEDI